MILRCASSSTKHSLCTLHPSSCKPYLSRLIHQNTPYSYPPPYASPHPSPSPSPSSSPNFNQSSTNFNQSSPNFNQSSTNFDQSSQPTTEYATRNPLHQHPNGPVPPTISYLPPNPFYGTLSLAQAFIDSSYSPFGPPPSIFPPAFTPYIPPSNEFPSQFPPPSNEFPSQFPPPSNEFPSQFPPPFNEFPSQVPPPQTGDPTLTPTTQISTTAEITERLEVSTAPPPYKAVVYRIVQQNDIKNLRALLQLDQKRKNLDGPLLQYLTARMQAVSTASGSVRNISEPIQPTAQEATAPTTTRYSTQPPTQPPTQLTQPPTQPTQAPTTAPTTKKPYHLFSLIKRAMQSGDDATVRKLVEETKELGYFLDPDFSSFIAKHYLMNNNPDFIINLALDRMPINFMAFEHVVLYLVNTKDDARLRTLIDELKIHEKAHMTKRVYESLMDHFVAVNNTQAILALFTMQDIPLEPYDFVWGLFNAQQCVSLFKHVVEKGRCSRQVVTSAATRILQLRPDESTILEFAGQLATVPTLVSTLVHFSIIRAMIQVNKTDIVGELLQKMPSAKLVVPDYEELIELLDLAEESDRALLHILFADMKERNIAPSLSVIVSMMNAALRAADYSRVLCLFGENANEASEGTRGFWTIRKSHLLACAHLRKVDEHFFANITAISVSAPHLMLELHESFQNWGDAQLLVEIYDAVRRANGKYPPQAYNDLLPLLVQGAMDTSGGKYAKPLADYVVDALEACVESDVKLLPKVYEVVDNYVKLCESKQHKVNGDHTATQLDIQNGDTAELGWSWKRNGDRAIPQTSSTPNSAHSTTSITPTTVPTPDAVDCTDRNISIESKT